MSNKRREIVQFQIEAIGSTLGSQSCNQSSNGVIYVFRFNLWSCLAFFDLRVIKTMYIPYQNLMQFVTGYPASRALWLNQTSS